MALLMSIGRPDPRLEADQALKERTTVQAYASCLDSGSDCGDTAFSRHALVALAGSRKEAGWHHGFDLRRGADLSIRAAGSGVGQCLVDNLRTVLTPFLLRRNTT